MERFVFSAPQDLLIIAVSSNKTKKQKMGRRNLTDAARIQLALKKEELLKAVAKERQKRADGDKTRAGALLAKSSTEFVHMQRDTAI